MSRSAPNIIPKGGPAAGGGNDIPAHVNHIVAVSTAYNPVVDTIPQNTDRNLTDQVEKTNKEAEEALKKSGKMEAAAAEKAAHYAKNAAAEKEAIFAAEKEAILAAMQVADKKAAAETALNKEAATATLNQMLAKKKAADNKAIKQAEEKELAIRKAEVLARTQAEAKEKADRIADLEQQVKIGKAIEKEDGFVGELANNLPLPQGPARVTIPAPEEPPHPPPPPPVTNICTCL